MKRIGLLLLLSASYAGLLTLVFSTDFSRENSFLLPESAPISPAKAFESSMIGEDDFVAVRIADFYATQNLPMHQPNSVRADAAQSPESADHE